MVTLKSAVRRALRYLGDDDSFEHDNVSFEHDKASIDNEVDRMLGAEAAQLRAANRDLERRNTEYFDLIAAIERQRDEWKTMYFDGTAKNTAAHAMYQRIIENLSHQNKKALVVLNGFLEKLGHPQVKTRDDLLVLSVSLAEDYKEHIGKLTAAAPVDIDGLAERERIAGASQDPAP